MHNYAIVLNNMQANVFSLPESGGLHFPCRVYGRKHLTYLRDHSSLTWENSKGIISLKTEIFENR